MRVAARPLVHLFPSESFHRSKNANFIITPRFRSSFPSKIFLLTKLRSETLASLPPRRTMAAPASSQLSVQVREKIEPTVTEAAIFERLLKTLDHFGLQNQLRVAGGWVRDKLLGKDCYDIDIALDNMSGSEFVEKVTEYLSEKGEKAQGIAVIPSNPDQSKHLETARMRICDVWIDFVNLRCEEYSENSRIPTKQTYGTPEEDAYRRDLTINSLFYNINTKSVEDYTKRGIADLKSGKIVTPLPPKATFMDDPLRVLRAIRFGARFDFVLDEELKEAAASDDVRAALNEKISRERIGTEIDLMVSGNQPCKAMACIHDLKLFYVVFFGPPSERPKFEPAIPDRCERLCTAYLDATWSLIQFVGYSSFTVSGKSTKNGSAYIVYQYWDLDVFVDEQRRLSLYAAMFLPLRNTTYISEDKRSKTIAAVDFIFRGALKRKVSDSETVINIHKASEKFWSLIPFLASDEDIQEAKIEWAGDLVDIPVSSKLRVLTGILLREIKDFWRVALLISTLYKIDPTENLLNKNFQPDKLRDMFKAAENSIIELGLAKVWDVKPLVNGKEIMNTLELKSGGRLVGEWQQKLLKWQLAHPSATSEEFLKWMRQKRLKTE